MPTQPIQSLSVVVFTYNHARWLPRLLDGVASQSRRPERVAVFDDASPRDTEADLRAAIAERPGTSGLDVSLHRHPQNLGVVGNYRHGIGTVTEDAYMLHAGDDYLVDPDFLADAVAILDAHPSVNVVFGLLRRVGVDGRVIHAEPPTTGAPYSLISGPEMRARLAYYNPVFAPCTVTRTSVHTRLPAFPLPSPVRHDWQQWVLLSYYGDFARIERSVMHSMIHGDNISVGAAQSRRMRETMAGDYEAVIARPEVGEADAALLREGLAWREVHEAPVRELPGALWRHRRHGAFGSALRSSVGRRLATRLRQLGASAERERMAARVGGPLDLGAARLTPKSPTTLPSERRG